MKQCFQFLTLPLGGSSEARGGWTCEEAFVRPRRISMRPSPAAPAADLPGGQGRPVPNRRGLTLLETMLAIAILGLSLAAIGVLVRFGMRNAERARDGTTAQIIAESVMNEVAAGSLPAQSIGLSPYDPNNNTWLVAINVAPLQNPPLPLVEVRVFVQQNLEQEKRPISFELVRWMPDPTVELPADNAAIVGGEGELPEDQEMLPY